MTGRSETLAARRSEDVGVEQPRPVIAMAVAGVAIESVVLRAGAYAYPGGIREVTLWAGETYQIPLTETFFFGGLGRLAISEPRKQWVRFFAIFGAVHLSFFLVYTVPNQWLSTHSDPHPDGYPSYLENGMCASGAEQDQCPGVPMPRPTYNPN